MGNADFGWVGKIQSVQTNFGSGAKREAAAQEIVNQMLEDGWRLLAIVNDTKLVVARGGVDLQVTASYFVLGRSD